MFKTSWCVLRQDRELLWLTVINLVVCLAFIFVVFTVVFVAAVLVSASGLVDDSWWEDPHPFNLFLATLLAVVGIVLSNTFFHGAIVHGALERLSGGDPTVRSALAGARSRFGKLMLWGLTALTIGAVLRLIQSFLARIPFAGWFLNLFIDIAWAVLGFLAIPIVIMENQGPFASLKRSKDLLKSTWGENVIVQFGLGVVGWMLGVLGTIVGVLFIAFLAAIGPTPVVVVGAVLLFLYLVGIMLFISALNSVLQSVLYHYAVKGEVPAGFDGQDLSTAFAPKSEPGLGRHF